MDFGDVAGGQDQALLVASVQPQKSTDLHTTENEGQAHHYPRKRGTVVVAGIAPKQVAIFSDNEKFAGGGEKSNTWPILTFPHF